MKKYVKKPEIVSAEIYNEGMEDAFTLFVGQEIMQTDYSSRKEAEKSAKTLLTGFKEGTAYRAVPYLCLKDGITYIHEGDYILTDMDGNRRIISPDKFKMCYEEVEG